MVAVLVAAAALRAADAAGGMACNVSGPCMACEPGELTVDYCLATGHKEAVHCERLSQQTDQAPYPREFQSCTPSNWPDDFVQFELVMAGVFAVAYVLLQRRKRVVAMAHYQRIHGREMDPLDASRFNV